MTAADLAAALERMFLDWRVFDSERAVLTEAARRLREVERIYAAMRDTLLGRVREMGALRDALRRAMGGT
jgi:hypothetical protein